MLHLSDSNTLNALINLLDEPDETAFGLIRSQIILRGMDALEPLERAVENEFNPDIQARIQSIIKQLNQENLIDELSGWVRAGSSDLLKGFILVTKTEFPSLNDKEIVIMIEQLKMDIWIELHENLTAFENVKVMNRILFDIHHFHGKINETTHTENNYINFLLENKTGSPLSLGILFTILAQKLGLPVFGVNLPQHFILAYLTTTGIENPGESDVLFYINPFNKGVVFTRREIELFIQKLKVAPETSFFAPCSNIEIIHKLIKNLILCYDQLANTEKVEYLETLLVAFE